jgi:hypothetical protein
MGLTWDVTFIRTIPGMLMAGEAVSFYQKGSIIFTIYAIFMENKFLLDDIISFKNI